MDEAARVQLYWDLKSRTTAQRGQAHIDAQTPPVRFGPNRVQTPQPRPVRRARVLSSEDRRARLAQQGQPAAPPPPAGPAPPPPAVSEPEAPPPSSQPPPPPLTPAEASRAQPASPPPASSRPLCPADMEWSSSPSLQPTATMSSPPTHPTKPPLFPVRPQVFCIPACPPPIIPTRLFKFSFPFLPPPFPVRTSLFSLPCEPPIPPRPFIFSVRYPGIPPRPYFLSGECVPVGPAIPDRLFFLSGQCVSYFFAPFSLLMFILCRFASKIGLPEGIFLLIFGRCFLCGCKIKKTKRSKAVYFLAAKFKKKTKDLGLFSFHAVSAIPPSLCCGWLCVSFSYVAARVSDLECPISRFAVQKPLCLTCCLADWMLLSYLLACHI